MKKDSKHIAKVHTKKLPLCLSLYSSSLSAHFCDTLCPHTPAPHCWRQQTLAFYILFTLIFHHWECVYGSHYLKANNST